MKTKIDELPTAATTLRDLLLMGAQITFHSGRSMRGDVRNGYVDVSNEFGGLGAWDLDRQSGVDDAIADLVKDARESGLTLHGQEIEAEEDDVVEIYDEDSNGQG